MNTSIHLAANRTATIAGRWLGTLLLLTLGLATLVGSGGGGDAASPTLSLPAVTSQPANTTVDDGASATFSVTATSSTPLSYQWRKNGTNVTGATASSISVTAPYSDNAARYSVAVANTDGSVTSTEAVLTVTPLAPTINSQPLSVTVQSGSTATFAVAVSGGTGPIAYQWRKGAANIAGATGASYTTEATTVADNAAAFTVAVTSPSGTLVSSAATLTVSTTPQAPAISAQPQSQTVALGQTATFSVVASSASAITYQWSRNGSPVAGATGASYTTAAVVAGDDGAAFTAAVTNTAGTSTSAAATLTISNLPSAAVTQVSTGLRHSVALKSDGTVWSWGFTGSGLMGVGSEPVTAGAPTRAKNADGSVLTGVASVSAGYDHTMVVKSDGTVWGWSANGGALGDGSTTTRTSPVQVKNAAGVPFTSASGVSAGQNFTLAVKLDGTVWAWGINSYATLGDGTNTTRLNPVQVLAPGGGGLTGVAKVVAGQLHSMSLKTDGTVWSWGRNHRGQLGDGTPTAEVALPVRADVTPGVALANVVSIAAGVAHSAAARADGTAYAWGENNYGELGDGTTADRSRPTLVKDAAGNALTGVVAVAAGDNYTMFLKSDGSVWAAGRNHIGQLGDNTTTATQINPNGVKDAAGVIFGNVSRVALTQQHTVVLRGDGTVWAWGYNGYRQLGDTSTANRRNPVQVPVSGP